MTLEPDGKFQLDAENLLSKLFNAIIPKRLRRDILPEDGSFVRIKKALSAYDNLPRWKKNLQKYSQAWFHLNCLKDDHEDRMREYPIPKVKIN